jgi:hypothetical protein
MGGCCGSSNERGKPAPPKGGVKKNKEPVELPVPAPEIKYYWFRGSQPARALYCFLKYADIEFESVEFGPGDQK